MTVFIFEPIRQTVNVFKCPGCGKLVTANDPRVRTCSARCRKRLERSMK
jgi:endogenous inhibitor of DNA gyrase (YacG/DUF329 family)